MVERTTIETYVRHLVATDIMCKPLSSLSGKVDRRKEKTAREISSLLKNDYEIGERVFARIETRDEEKARTLREGIDAFNKEYPTYGKILEGKIAEKRTKNNKYLVFGIAEGYQLGREDYIRVMKDLGLNEDAACAMYPHLKEVSDQLGKAKEQAERSILL